jgi:cyclohexanone monooxygenase
MDKAREQEFKADYDRIRAAAKQTPPGILAEYGSASLADSDVDDYTNSLEKRWQAGGLTFLADYADVLLDPEANARAADFVRNKIRAVVKDPATAETLCPKNIIGGKRLCLDSHYFETYNRDNVSLVDLRSTPIDEITAKGISWAAQHREFDVIVVATGFDAMTGALRNIDIRGTADDSLSERWADGPSSYLGLAMADFPNLFTVTGPGSPSVFTNMLPTIEQHVEWITDCIGFMNERNLTRIEASAAAEKEWWDHVQDVAAVGLKASTESWYMGANVAGKARVFMPYFGGFPEYCRRCEAVVNDDYAGFEFA